MKYLTSEQKLSVVTYYTHIADRMREIDPRLIKRLVRNTNKIPVCVHLSSENGIGPEISSVFASVEDNQLYMYATCGECDERFAKFADELVACDDCGENFIVSDGIMFEYRDAEPIGDDHIVLICFNCSEKEAHQIRLYREKFWSNLKNGGMKEIVNNTSKA